jgi:hypothetical protein
MPNSSMGQVLSASSVGIAEERNEIDLVTLFEEAERTARSDATTRLEMLMTS